MVFVLIGLSLEAPQGTKHVNAGSLPQDWASCTAP